MTKHFDGKRAAVRRATYYLRPDQIRGLKMCAAVRDRQVSDVMRDAVDRYLRFCAPLLRRYQGGRVG